MLYKSIRHSEKYFWVL